MSDDLLMSLGDLEEMMEQYEQTSCPRCKEPGYDGICADCLGEVREIVEPEIKEINFDG